ncbi:MAG: hypothetical protein NC213_06825 [Acetobacter sp.]|nr:hypothetical protein [Bacteroides sp.]MCM1341440.1 hypothetical protein [Acetobacter sp.]MCM1433392.1 hypothetical protein [Clostridiales bacterium]
MKHEKLVGEEKITLSPKNKKKLIACIVVSVFVVLIIAMALFVKFNQTAVYNQVLYTFMTKSETVVINEEKNTELTLYIRKNPDYDVKKNEKMPLEAFDVYYFDKDGKEVDIGTGSLIYEGEDCGIPCLGFLLKAVQKLNTVKNVLVKVLIAFAVVAVIALIFIWYIIWSKHEDEEKAKRLSKTTQSKKK